LTIWHNLVSFGIKYNVILFDYLSTLLHQYFETNTLLLWSSSYDAKPTTKIINRFDILLYGPQIYLRPVIIASINVCTYRDLAER